MMLQTWNSKGVCHSVFCILFSTGNWPGLKMTWRGYM